VTRIGTGFVDIQPDLSGFQTAVRRELAKVDSDFKRVGSSAKSAFADGVGGAKATRDIDAMRSSLGSFEKDLKRSRAAITNTAGSVNLFARDGRASFAAVGGAVSQSSAKVQKAGADIQRSVSASAAELRKVERDAKRAGKGFEGLLLATGGGGGGLQKLASQMDDFGRSAGGASAIVGGLRIALVAILPAALGFGGAIGAVIAALAPLAGLAAAGAQGLAALGQGMGTFALATAGVSGALKEQLDNQSKVAKAAISNAGAQRSAARAIQSARDGIRSATQGLAHAADDAQSAEQALTDAQKDARGAQKALSVARTDARRALTDMASSLQHAVLDELEATQNLADAQKALRDLKLPATQEALADAARSVTEALHGQQRAALALEDAQQSLADLDAQATDQERRRAAAVDYLARSQQFLAVVNADVNATYLDRVRAQEQVAAATTAVNDANAAATVTELDRKKALQAVTDAQDGVAAASADAARQQQALQALQAGAPQEEIRQATLAVAQATLALTDATRDRARQAKDLADAEKKGVEGSAQVVQARQAIADADRRVAEAQKGVQDANERVANAQLAVTRASQTLVDAQLDAKEATAAQAIASEDLNKKLHELPPAAQAFVKQLVAMKPRLDELRQTAAAGLFPGVIDGLQAAMRNFGSVNKVVGETATVLGDAARKSGELVGSPAFGRDFETIGHNNAQVMETLGEALRHVVSALRHVLVVAGPLTQWLADVINKWTLNAAAAAKSGRETGKMAEFFEKTRAVAERLGSILGHLVSGLIGVGSAGQKSGNDILASIDRAAQHFDQWANSVGGRREIREFFETTKELAAGLTQVLAGVTSGIVFMTLKVLPLAAALRLLGPLADEATTAFIAYKAAALAAGVATTVATFATGGWVTAFWALNAAIYAFPGTWVIAAIAAVIAAGYLLIKNWDAVKGALVATWGWIKQASVDTFGAVTAAVRASWEWIRTATSSVWSGIRSFLTGAWQGISSAASSAWSGIRSVILAPMREARDLLTAVWGQVRDTATGAWGKIKDGVGGLASGIKDAVVDGVKGGLNTLISFINKVIDVVNVLPWVDIDHIDKIGEKPKDQKVDKKARGGAFARTGGVVNAPITLMGEEAPMWPEFVVPTNPAYRKRAQALLMQAAQSIGMASGGIYSKADLVALWKKANNGLGDANLMAAIALAESGGDPNAGRSHPYHGLWQVGPGGPWDPFENALAAGVKLRTQGLTAWEAYTNGRYRQFLGGDSGGGGGILGKITGAIGDLLSKGADWVLDKLPGVGGLPDWLKDMGKGLLSQAADWIKGGVSDAIGLGGGGGAPGGGVSGSIQGAMALARQMGLQITSTTGGNHVANSWHYKGRAADVAGTPAQMAAFYRAALARYGSHLLELFYDPIGAIKNGHSIPAIGGHSDHVHIALAKGGVFAAPYGGSFATGGIVPGPIGAPRTIVAHGGERVSTMDGASDLADQLRILNGSPTADVIRALIGVVNTSQGRTARHRALTAGYGGFPATP
jgi:phage-related protein